MSKKLIAGAGVVASLAVALAPLATFADVAGSASDQHTDQLVVNVLPSCTFGSSVKGSNTPWPGGITHDNSQGDYGADGDTANQPYTHGATNWSTSANGGGASSAESTDASGALHDGSGNTTDHNTGDVASTGYGVAGEGMATSTNGLANLSEHTVHRSMLAGTTTSTFAQTTMWIVCNNGEGYTVTANATALENEDTTPLTISPVAVGGYSATQSGYNGIVSTSDTTSAPTNLANIVSTDETTIADKAGVTKENGDSITVTYGMGIASSQKADTYAGTVTYKLYKGVSGS